MKYFFRLFPLAVLFQTLLWAQSPSPVDDVDPFIGTDFFGHTFPGASLPNAMVHLSPDTGTQGWTYSAGYTYADNSIIGFSHTHWSGVGMVNGGEILLMPTTNQRLQIVPGTAQDPDAGYRSRFDHEQEQASPGTYEVYLKDHKVQVALTATQRAGFHKYTFPKTKNARIILDLGHQIGEAPKDAQSELRIIGNNQIEGSKDAGLGKVYFVARFSKPFLYYGTFDAAYRTPESDGGAFPYKSGEKGSDIGAFVQYHTEADESVLVKVGISYTSIEGARKNLEVEIPHWDFDGVKSQARDVWHKALLKIRLEKATQTQRVLFYTALYRSLLAQYIAQDVDGNYFGSDGQVHIAKDYDFYGSFSCWDTYRSQHPLMTLVAPEHINDYIKSIEAKVRNYGWLPAQHFLNVYGEAMVGDHLVPVIVDAYLKGYRDYDVGFLYEAMRKKALELPKLPVPEHAARAGLNDYLELGYVPIDKHTEAVPNTLGMAYDDWCIAQLAKALGKPHDYALFMERAQNYNHLWDAQTQFMRPKKQNGQWLEALGENTQEIVSNGDHTYYKYFDPLLVGRRPNRHYTESNAWQYQWSVPHDVTGLIKLFGGNKAFTDRLDTFFEMSPVISPPKYVGVVGTIGQYVHGNQPSHHVAYLYNYAGEPWKTQARVRQVCDQFYRKGPGGLSGNEDMGSLSSWYVLSAMGFYPVSPGSNVYAIGSPQLERVSITLPKGKTFTIATQNGGKGNPYIQSATLNGKTFDRTWISHEEILAGGTLSFLMGPKPNTQWGVSGIPPAVSPSLE